MSICVADEWSRQAYAASGTSLFFYDGGLRKAGSLVATLQKEPNQVQNEFADRQIAVALWDLGLVCYSVPSGDILWQRGDLLRVERIVYSEASGTYYVRLEDKPATIALNTSGVTVESQEDFTVSCALDRGRLLLATSVSEGRFVISSVSRALVARVTGPLKTPVRAVTGNETLMALASMGGRIDILCLRTGRYVFSIEQRNWFSVSSMVQMSDPLKFRALVSDWGGQSLGAVIEIDANKQEYSLIHATGQWNWDSRLLNRGDSVLRFFSDNSDRFVVTDL